jgi:outer membrane protein assembly factor BamB
MNLFRTRPNRSRFAGISLLRVSALAAMLALTGCNTISGWLGGETKKQDKAASSPAELSKFTPSATVSRLWSAKAGDGDSELGIVQFPAVADGRVYAAAGEDGVRAFDLRTGKQLWRYESDSTLTGGPAVGKDGAGNDLVAAGGLDGEVVALDAATGAEKWTAKVNAEVIAAPAIGQGMVVVRSNDGRVTAFDAENGQRRWFWNHDLPTLTLRGNDAPLLGPGFVFVGNDDGSLVALALTDGRPLWEQDVGQPDGRSELDRIADVDGTPVLDGPTIYATSFKKQTIAIDGPSGRALWAQDNGGGGRLGLASDRLIVADPQGIVWALEKTGGSSLWQQQGLARRGLSGAAVHGDFAVVGDAEGYLHWMRLDNGDFAARVRVAREALRAAPVVVDGVLIAQAADGSLSAYALQ